MASWHSSSRHPAACVVLALAAIGEVEPKTKNEFQHGLMLEKLPRIAAGDDAPPRALQASADQPGTACEESLQ